MLPRRPLLLAFLVPVLLCAQAPTPPKAGPDAAKQAPTLDQAAGGVSVLPNRVVLEGRVRSAEIVVKNSGATRAMFRISMHEMDMTIEGRLAERTKKQGELTASDMVRFTPRQVTLEPGESQIVRVQLRKPEDLKEGEYRSHLAFTGIPPAKQAEPVAEEGGAKVVSFAINQVLSISIPVIVRHGECKAEVAWSNGEPVFYQPSYPNSAPVLNLWLERKGNRSLVGDVLVTLESGWDKPKGTPLSFTKNVGIYTNLERRKVFLGVPTAAGGKMNGAKVKVTFTSTDCKASPASTIVELKL